MPNVIKYTTGATETGCLRKGDMLIGNNTADYGLTFYNGVDPQPGGYTIYLNKASGGPSIYCPANDSQLITITNQIAGASYTTAAQCLTYYATQTDKVCVNRDYEGIVTDGLVLNLDAGFTPSYPKNGTTWYDLVGNNNGTLTNGPTYSTDGGGSIVFDGSDDNVKLTNISYSYLSASTIEVVFKINSYNGTGKYAIAGYDFNGGNYSNSTTGMIYVESTNKIKSAVITSTQVYREVVSTTNVSFNTYYFVTLIKDTVNGILKLYVNGTFESQTTFDASTYAQWQNPGQYIGNNNFIIGGYNSNNWGGGPNLNGVVYNVKLYDRLISDSEILQNYNAQKGRFGL